eukprot:Seg1498.5 transcript_id=Seg1498.5/GoldUCD/mRNA.D3Y31 product="hypothetical protein" protein_id=Seg1498.5/GoldUCD/D3Y31
MLGDPKKPINSVGETLDDPKKPMNSVGEMLDDPKKPMNSVGEMLGDPKKPIYSVGETLGDPKKPTKSIGEMLGDPKKPIYSVGETLDDPKKPMKSIGEMLGNPKKPMKSIGEMLGDPKKPIYSVGETLGDPKKPMKSIGEMLGDPKKPMKSIGEMLGDPKKPIYSVGETLGDPKKPMKSIGEMLGDPKKPINSVGETLDDPKKPMHSVGEMLDDPKKPMNSVGEMLGDPKKPIDSVGETLGDPKKPMNSVGEMLGDPKKPINSVGETLDDPKKPMDSVGEMLGDPRKPMDSVGEVMQTVQNTSLFAEETQTVVTSELSFVKLSSDIVNKYHTASTVKGKRSVLNIGNTTSVANGSWLPKGHTASSTKNQNSLLIKGQPASSTKCQKSLLIKGQPASSTKNQRLFLIKGKTDCSTEGESSLLCEGQGLTNGQVSLSTKGQPASSNEGHTASSTECQTFRMQSLKERQITSETKSSFLNQNEVTAALNSLNEDSCARSDSALTFDTLPGGFKYAILNDANGNTENIALNYLKDKGSHGLLSSDSLLEAAEDMTWFNMAREDCCSNITENISTQEVQPANASLASVTQSTAVAKNVKPAMHKSTCTYQPTVRYRARRRSLDSNEIASTTLRQNCSKGNRSAIERRVSDVREKSKEILSAKKKLRINRTAQSPIYIDLESGTSSVTSTSAVPDRSKQSQTLPKTGESLFKKKRPRIDGTQQDPIGITQQSGTKAKDFVSSIQTVYVPDSSAVPILSEKSKAPPKTGKSLSAKKRPRMDGAEQNSIDTEQQNGTKTTILVSTSETKSLPSTSTVPVIREQSQQLAESGKSLSAKKRPRMDGTEQNSIDTEQQNGTKTTILESTSETKSLPSTSTVPVISEQSQQPAESGKSLSAKKRPRLEGTEKNSIDTEQQNGTRTTLHGPSTEAKSIPSTDAVAGISEQSQQPAESGKSLSAKKRPRLDGTEQNPVDTEQQNWTRTLYGPAAEIKSVPSTSTVPVIREQSQQPAERGKSLSAKKRPRLDGTKQKPFDTEQQNWTRTLYGPSAETKSVPSTSTVQVIREQSQLPPKIGELLLLSVPIDQLNEELINHCIMNNGFKIEFSCPFDFENGHLLPVKWYWRVRPDKKIESRTTQTDFDDTAYRVISRILPRPDRAEKALKSGLIENGKNKISRQIQTDEVPMSCHTCAPDLSLPHTGIDKSCPTCRSKTVSSCSTQTAINDRSDPTWRDRTFHMDSNVDDESYTTGTDKPSWAFPMELTDTENSSPHSFTDKLRTFSTQTDEDNSLCEIGTLENIKSTGNHSQCCLAENSDISLCHNCVFSKALLEYHRSQFAQEMNLMGLKIHELSSKLQELTDREMMPERRIFKH